MSGQDDKFTIHRGAGAVVAIAAAAVIFFAFNIVQNATLTSARLDLTEGGVFTISEGTRHVLESLQEPVTLSFFFSEKAATPYPTLFRYGRRVRDLLKEYEAIADGKVDLRIIDPEPFSEQEDEAVRLGLQGIPTANGDNIYLGLAANDTTNRQSVIPYFAEEREPVLEYELTKTIVALSEDSRVKVALLSSLPLQFGPGGVMAFAQGQSRPYAIYDMLQSYFDVETLDAGFNAIPEDADVLIVIHPPALDDTQLYAIDQFILRGGRGMFFVDPYSEMSAQMPPPAGGFGAPPPVPESSNLRPLFAAWGINFDDTGVIGDLQFAQRVNMGGGGPRAIRDYIIWLGIPKTNFNRDDVVTGMLGTLNFATAGALSPAEGASTTFTPLVWSSEVSAPIDRDRVKFNPDPDELIRDLQPDEMTYTILARVSGTATSAFPDGNPDEDQDRDSAEPSSDGTDSETEAGSAADTGRVKDGAINIVVGADSDFIDDRFWVRIRQIFGQQIVEPVAHNGALVVNIADQLSGSDELISLRSRGVTERPFTVVENLRRDAETRFREQEQALQQRLQETEARINELQGSGEATEFLSPEQEAEIEQFRAELLDTRQQLREVQRNLRRDVDSLRNRLAFINIALVPIVLVIFAIGLEWRRVRRA